MNDSKQEPEPVWLSGDVIRIAVLKPHNPYATLIQKDGIWRGVHDSTTDSRTVSRYWNDGAVEILYKVGPTVYGVSGE